MVPGRILLDFARAVVIVFSPRYLPAVSFGRRPRKELKDAGTNRVCGKSVLGVYKLELYGQMHLVYHKLNI